jgi:hypothetical protein
MAPAVEIEIVIAGRERRLLLPRIVDGDIADALTHVDHHAPPVRCRCHNGVAC